MNIVPIWKRSSLSQKFSIGSITLTLLVAVVIGGISQGFLREYVTVVLRNHLREEVRLNSQRFELHLNAAAHNLETLAANSLTINALVDSEGRMSYLVPFIRDFRVSDTLLVDIGLFDFQGKLIARSAEAVEEDISQEDVFAPAINGTAAANYHAHDGEHYIAIALPVRHPSTGQPEGVLLGRMDVTPLFRSLPSWNEEQAVIRMESGDGQVVGTMSWPSGIDMMTMKRDLQLRAPLDGPNFALVVGQDKRAALAPLNSLAWNILLAASAIVLLSIWASVIIGRRLARPIVELSAAARLIVKDGNLHQPLPPQGPDEVGQLSKSFEEMLSHLIESYSTLEDKVTERTHELNEARLRLSENAAQLAGILDNVADAILTIDGHGNIQSANKAVETLYGYGLDELIGHNIEMLLPIPARPAFQKSMAAFRKGKKLVEIEGRQQGVSIRKDGKMFEIEYALGEVQLGGRTLLTGIVRDISERKKIERTKDEFISSVSHELRTPLTSIRGALALLKSSRKEALPARASSLVGVAYKNCERLEALVNDILDIEKLESGTLEFDREPVDLVALIAQAVEINAPYMSGHGKVARVWPVSGTVVTLGDEGRLMQVMNNLLSNAAKYSHDGSPIDVLVARRGENVRVAVADLGPGIDAEFRQRIFSRFGQADSSDTRKVGGTGLGLAISKAIIEKHGGTLSFRTRKDSGVVFYFDLPLQSVGGHLPTVELGSYAATGPQGHPDLDAVNAILVERGVTPIVFATPADVMMRVTSGAFLKFPAHTQASHDALGEHVTQSAETGLYPLVWLGQTKPDFTGVEV